MLVNFDQNQVYRQKDYCMMVCDEAWRRMWGFCRCTGRHAIICHPSRCIIVSLKKSATNHSTFWTLLVKLMERFYYKYAPVINHLIKIKHLRWSSSRKLKSTIIQGKTVHTGQYPFSLQEATIREPRADDRCCWAPLILLHVFMFHSIAEDKKSILGPNLPARPRSAA